jgi:protein-S-isoprenylcysteine O-methyltransferase Ste14
MSRPVPPSLGDKGQGWVVLQFALVGLALVVGILDLSGWPPAYQGGLRYLGVLCLSAGVVTAVLAGLALGPSLTALPAPVEDGRLSTAGPYRYVRHPLYSALLVLVLGWALLSSPWVLVVLVVLGVELDLKRQVEEDFLERTYPTYPAYRDAVPWALVPYVR